MAQLQARLADLERDLASRFQADTTALKKGMMATVVAPVAGICTVMAGLTAFLQRGMGFISGAHIVLLVLIMAAGLVVYFSFVFGRTAKIKMEISKTKQLIEMASGYNAKKSDAWRPHLPRATTPRH